MLKSLVLLITIFLSVFNYGQENAFLLGKNIAAIEKKLIEQSLFDSPLINEVDSSCINQAFLTDLEMIFEESFSLSSNNLSESCNTSINHWINLFNTSIINSEHYADSLLQQLANDRSVNNTYKALIQILLAKLLINNNKFPKALAILHQSEEIITNENHKRLIKCFQNLLFIDIFHVQKQGDKQLRYIHETLAIADSINSIFIKARTLNEYSRYHMSFKNSNTDSALICGKEALKYYTLLGLRKKIAHTNNAIASIYQEKNNINPALNYYQQALSTYIVLKDTINSSFVLNNIGNVYFKQKEYSKALTFYLKASETLERIDPNNRYLYIFYFNLSEVYESLNDYKNALAFFKKFDELEYEKLNESKQKEVAQLQEKYQSEQREQKIIQLNAENKIQQLQLEKKTTQRNYIIGFACIGLLLISSIAGVYILNKQKTVFKLRKEMAEKNQALTSLALENENSTIKALSLGQETERKRIALYLHDHIGNRIFAIKTNLLANARLLGRHSISIRPILALTEIMRREIRELSHQLTDKYKPSFSLPENLEKLATTFNITPDLEVLFKLKGNVKLPSHIAIELYRIAQEALTNALKYSNASTIIIMLEQTQFELILSIVDNGIGIQKETSGIGIINMKQRAESIGGTFIIDKDVAYSTKIIVQLLTN